MLFKCFIKIAYGSGELWDVGREDLCQRHHRGTHKQQQKVSFGYMSKSKERKQHGTNQKKKKTPATTVKINKKN